jgi:hypothetical protein
MGANCHLPFLLYINDLKGQEEESHLSTPYQLICFVPSELSLSTAWRVTSPTVWRPLRIWLEEKKSEERKEM